MTSEKAEDAPMHGLVSLPVFFKLAGRRVLVAGGSAGAAWKAELLQATGAHVAVVSAAPGEDMRVLAARTSTITLVTRDWTESDFADVALAIGDFATEGEAARFRDAARRARVPINVVDKPNYCDFQFGTIIDRSPLVVAISTAGAAPVFALALRGRIEALLPQSLKTWAQAAQTWRPKLGDAESRRRFWEHFVTRALGSRAPKPHDFDELIEAAQRETETQKTTIACLAITSGDPELLTLKALRLLQSGEVVFYDAGIAPQIVGMARRESARIRRDARDDVAALILAEARKGKRMVWLAAGEPDDTIVKALNAAGFAIDSFDT
ncbi:MAG: NAD(P)-dependent oxidoreductase [Methylovirgula sp.]|uniref:NAD(P)-dependent oxidoreductase n=1 Tax=Methylovirgula sp. TaxID=1978224 RepID=UPI00307622F5